MGGLFTLLFLAGVVFIAFLFIVRFGSTDVDEYGLHYSSGPIEGKQFVKVVPPGSGLRPLGLLDEFVKLPANQRTYIVASDGTGDSDQPIIVTDSEGVAYEFETSATFELPGPDQAELLSTFRDNICTKYADCQDAGWGMMLDDYMLKAQQSALNAEVRTMTTDELMTGDISSLQRRVAETTEDKLAQNMDGRYFQDITFQIQRPVPPERVQDRYDEAKAQELQTEVKKELVAQAEQEAKAAQKLAQTLNTNPNYLQLEYIRMLEKGMENGSIQFYALPAGTDMNVPTPGQ